MCGELYKLQAYKLPVRENIEIGIKLERLLGCFLFKKEGIRINLNADEMDSEARMWACGIFREQR